MNFKNIILFLFILFIITCDNPLTQDKEYHCVIDYNGFFDDCGVCSGGSSGHIANSEKDCNDECNGLAVIDGCGICNGDGTSCEDTCDNFDCNGICDGGAMLDECGICNGYNSNKDLCGICFGDNNSCNIGLITLSNWHFSEIHFWSNSDCSGFPYNSFYNNICIDDLCYDFEINFYFDTINGSYNFSQINKMWNSSLSNDISENIENGLWYFNNSSLCLDYNNVDLEDNCYEMIEFENTFFDCETNIDNCINNIIDFSNMNSIENTCSKEKYDSINNTSIYSNSNNLSTKDFSITFQNLFKSFDLLSK